ncbi:cytoplasmic tRNA 2-thiolation protein 2 isoform X2 [Microcaecilia unicolor]|uniref:Cytoplasmic tRNA 2-thiolation protein 2 n=1 Tax=Microcaecilia unicolor TaxID=1415580 RepID=A0A6P7XYG4_9AMPH|nr:cytoplasmic tRNA 2-thiolation protein 2 isoform X2 [Microcaecilia unicolor]
MEWLSLEQKCMKCKECSAVLIIRVGDAFCKACFKEYFVHKFRAMLGKKRLIYPGEKVLLALSGGPASSSMLQQVQEGLSWEAGKKLRFVPGLVHIDEGAVRGQNLKDREKMVAEVELVLKRSGFPYQIIFLEEVFNLPSSVVRWDSKNIPSVADDYKAAVDGFLCRHTQLKNAESGIRTCSTGAGVQAKLAELSIKEPEPTASTRTLRLPSAQSTQALNQLFDSVTSLTAKEELLHTLRSHLLIHTARAQGYSKVMLGDSCTRLAVKFLTNISLGRGAFLAMDTGFSDGRYGDVVLVRPMREYSLKEISAYNEMFGVPTFFSPALNSKPSEKGSIHQLTETFINKLQSDFPSTVSTVFRTSEKLNVAGSVESPDSDSAARCLFCLCPLDTQIEKASAFHATLVSEHLSQKRSPDLPEAAANQCCASSEEERRCCRKPAEGCSSTTRADERLTLLDLLCYGCRVTTKDLTMLDHLPHYVRSEADCRTRRAAMKKEIQEFLLHNNTDLEDVLKA